MRRATDARGFSIVEVLIVAALIAIGVSVGIVQIRSSIAVIDADKAGTTISSQILYARQVAISQRRNVQVSFVGSNQVTVTRIDGGGETTVLARETLPSGFAFAMPDGASDTPDGFGNASPVDFETTNGGKFLADGIFVNSTGDVMNGTVFTMGGSTSTARAVTLAGASGRIRTYHMEGGAWTE